jgi:hypothetical protein
MFVKDDDINMINEEQKVKLRGHLYGIEAEIMAAMQQDEHGPYWLVPYYEGKSPDFGLKQSQEIFNGDCGVALFFIALYEFDREPRHLELVRRVLARMLASEKADRPEFYCFYSGITDLVYTCIRMFELTGEGAYRLRAVELVYQHQEDIIAKVTKFDLLSGHAGNLMVLTFVYHYHPAPDILAIIHSILDKFIAQVRISAIGLKWDHFKFAFDSMAGFSHGASGIAYALMQVGNYFGYLGLNYLAQEALAYETQYYDANSQNWLDLRLGFVRLGLPDAHLWNINTFLPEINNVNSWAHGAAGIGLARLYTYKTTGEQLYLEQCRTIVARCKQDIAKKREDYTLCSGYGGMIPFLLQYQQYAQSSELTKDILNIANNAIDLYNEKHTYNTFIDTNRVDTGLLSGKAGVGHMLINILTNGAIKDVLCLQLPESKNRPNTVDQYNIAQVQYRVFNKYYTKTLQELLKQGSGFSKSKETKSIEQFEIHICQAIDQLPVHVMDHIKDVFEFEQAIVSLWKQHKGFLCYTKKGENLLQRSKKLLAEEDTLFLAHRFVLCSHVRLHYTYYAVNDTNDHRQLNAVLLCCDENGVKEIYIGRLVSFIIAQLINVATGAEVCDCLIGNNLDAGQAGLIKQKIMLQLRELIRSGLLEAVDE